MLVPIVRYIPILEIMKNEKYSLKYSSWNTTSLHTHFPSFLSFLKWNKRMVYSACRKSLTREQGSGRWENVPRLELPMVNLSLLFKLGKHPEVLRMFTAHLIHINVLTFAQARQCTQC